MREQAERLVRQLSGVDDPEKRVELVERVLRGVCQECVASTLSQVVSYVEYVCEEVNRG